MVEKNSRVTTEKGFTVEFMGDEHGEDHNYNEWTVKSSENRLVLVNWS